jgi:hypothetical protein
MPDDPTQPDLNPPQDPTPWMKSPWVQLGVPLAATLAAAIAPRHAGRAAQFGLSAFEGINAQRDSSMRLQDALQQHAIANQRVGNLDKMVHSLSGQPTATPASDASSPTPPTAPDLSSKFGQLDSPDSGLFDHTPAPNGGDTPAADMNAKTDAMNHGSVPSPTFSLSPDKARQITMMNTTDHAAAVKLFEDEVKRQDEDASKFEPTDPSLQGIAAGQHLQPGQKFTLPLRGGGSFSTDMKQPDAPHAPHFEHTQTGGRNVTYEYAGNGGDPVTHTEGPIEPNFSFHPDAVGNMFVGDPRAGTMRLASMLGGGGGGGQAPAQDPQADFRDVSSAGSSTGRTLGQSSTPTAAPSPAATAPAPSGAGRFGAGGRPSTARLPMAPDKIDTLLDSWERGEQVPDFRGMARAGDVGPIRVRAAERHLNLAKLQLDWEAQKTLVHTLNDSQQAERGQNLRFAKNAVAQVSDLYDKWQQVAIPLGMKALNRGELTLAMNSPDPALSSAAQALNTQINDTVFALQGIYASRGSVTDQSLKLAAENLNGAWNRTTFHTVTDNLDKAIDFRSNAMADTTTQGIGAGRNIFAPPLTPPGAGGQAAGPINSSNSSAPPQQKQPKVVRTGIDTLGKFGPKGGKVAQLEDGSTVPVP